MSEGIALEGPEGNWESGRVGYQLHGFLGKVSVITNWRPRVSVCEYHGMCSGTIWRIWS